MAEFEVFSRAMVPLRRNPTVTIQKNGILSLNRAAVNALGAPGAVELLYDRATRTIGLRAVDPDSENACALRAAAGPGSASSVVTAMAFLNHYGLGAPVSRRWQAYLDGDVLCVDLDSEATVVTSNRAKRVRPDDTIRD